MILPFELDPQIIHHIIHNQAGSIGKSIIELIMNSVDAKANRVKLTMNKEGFVCEDDGQGFATKEDVLNYFGRFGTPHHEGDATYGRFRLGRGQIMAHASTIWSSINHQMVVDTLKMGYFYDLIDLDAPIPGCYITGKWYDKLSDTELLSTLQEIRDLVRYTPVEVELNGKTITRKPEHEKWDHQDEYAYYRVKLEGAVSIYNQGVLVRHDASHIWGVGGLIVTKKAISLNVSRTEIIRKTCAVWQEIAKQFQTLAHEISDKLHDNRKTEARREKSVRSLLSGEGNLFNLVYREEVVTILPGNRHITLYDFIHRLLREHRNNCCIVENHNDIPKAETMAKAKISIFIHPKTLDRFGVYTPDQFLEILGLIQDNYDQFCALNGYDNRRYAMPMKEIELLDYSLLSQGFVERMEILKENTVLDRETRRAWTALRWCLQQYAGVCLGKVRDNNGALGYGEETFSILLGSSNTAEAWTDGEFYIAFNVEIIKKLKRDPLKTAAYIFSLLEHEIAHEGDSLDAGHDEVFYQRYHDISIRMSSERQWYMHIWLTKYTTSLEYEHKKASGRAWSERVLIDRVGNGRMKKGLPPLIEDASNDPIVQAFVPDIDETLVDQVNNDLILRGLLPDASQWDDILSKSKYIRDSSNSSPHQEIYPDDELIEWYEEEMAAERERICSIIEIEDSSLEDMMYYYLSHASEEEIKNMWAAKPWEDDGDSDQKPDETHNTEEEVNPLLQLDKNYHQYIETGETWWSLQRNAAAAGHHTVEKYLLWRAGK